MTPGARVAAAIEILDDIASGAGAEQALTRWARRSRFAGSGDRATVRDHVFDVLRSRSTARHYGQGTSGRAMMIGLLYQQGRDPDAVFTGVGHAPAVLSDTETAFPAAPTDRATLLNLPDWLMPEFAASLGPATEATALALQSRAPVFLRVNLARATRGEARAKLRAEGIETQENPLTDAALTVTEGARRIRNSQAFSDGLIELQDAASQAVVAALPPGGKVLDYCAGGGGKALALAMDPSREVVAHDIDPGRMADLPQRAERAGARIVQTETAALPNQGPFDIVLCDAPCSGSGAWRRAAEGKWTLTPDRLAALNGTQDRILDDAAVLVGRDGLLAYATCSVLDCENEARIRAFLTRHPDWKMTNQQRFAVNDHGDGFYTAHLTRA